MSITKMLTYFTLILAVLSGAVVGGAVVFGRTLPEGWQIDYLTRENDGTWYIETMDLDRHLQYRRSIAVTTRYPPLLSPDRQFALYEDDRAFVLHHLATGNETVFDNASPQQWSPDSRRFSYGFFGDNTGTFETFVVTINDMGEVLHIVSISDADNIGSARFMLWSPHGELSVYRKVRQVELAIRMTLYIADADGQNPRQIAPEAVNIRDVAWSPDSTQLVFVNEDFSSEAPLASLERINVDGSGRTQLAVHVGFQQSSLVWSPDGRFIAYALRTPSNANGLHIYEAETGTEIGYIDLNLNITDIRWSPDSTRLIFRSGRDSDFYVVDRDGRNIRRLTDNDNLNVLLP